MVVFWILIGLIAMCLFVTDGMIRRFHRVRYWVLKRVYKPRIEILRQRYKTRISVINGEIEELCRDNVLSVAYLPEEKAERMLGLSRSIRKDLERERETLQWKLEVTT